MVRAVFAVWVLVVATPVFAEAPPPTDPKLDAQFRADIAKVSAEAATAWDQGNVARDASRPDEAEAAFRRAIALAPNVDHPHRRLCNVLAAKKRFDEALHECELAQSLAPASPYDKAGIANTLSQRGDPADRPRAAKLAREAAEAVPDDAFIARGDCAARILNGASDDIEPCVDHLLALAPYDMLGNVVAASFAWDHGDAARADVLLERARSAGLPDSQYQPLRKRIDGVRHHADGASWLDSDHVLAIGAPVVGFWILLLLLLLVVGNTLSDATLRTLGHDAVDAATGTRMRTVYRIVLLLTGFLFYVSLPLMVVVVLFAGFGVIAAFDDAGATPILVLLLVGGVMLSTVLAVVRTLFAAKRSAPVEGTPIDLSATPKLRAFLDDVAAAIGTPPVDLVYLTPGTQVAMTEQRGLWRALRGARGERSLVLGVGLFDGMKQAQLRSLVAHEYGQFRNTGTGGVVAIAVQRSLFGLIGDMKKRRAATIFNPAWWFMRAFAHLYVVVSRGASRLQEVLADRGAIRAYGSAAFVSGVRHTIERAAEHKWHVKQTLKDVLENNWSLPNLYSYAPELAQSRSELAAEVAKELAREPQRFDTRLAPRQRIEAAEKLARVAERTSADDDEPVWSLFPDPERVERDMTAVVRDLVRARSGVVISDEEWDDEDDEPGAQAPGDAE